LWDKGAQDLLLSLLFVYVPNASPMPMARKKLVRKRKRWNVH